MKQKTIEINENHKRETSLINSLSSTIRRLSGQLGFGTSHDGKRDYNGIFGYGDELGYSDFYGLYLRSAYGNVVVDKIAKSTWGDSPSVKSDDIEILSDEIKQLSKAGLFSALQRADILNRIGAFSVLMVGVPDGLELDQPVGTISPRSKANDFYFNPYNYDGVEFLEFDNDPSSPRFNLPVIYQLQTSISSSRQKDIKTTSVRVHYSRIIHLAENALDSSLEGISSLMPIWNALIDCEKVRGGSGEAYFRNSRQQRVFQADKDSQLDPASDAMSALKQNIDEFDHGWDSTLRVQNMEVKHLPIGLNSPKDSFDITVKTISGQTGIPLRFLTGEGSGQTKGAEDRAAWNELIVDRRTDFANGLIVSALNLFASVGLFNLPDNFIVEWDALKASGEKERAEINKIKSDTLDKAVTAMGKPVGDELEEQSVFKELGLDKLEKIDDLE